MSYIQQELEFFDRYSLTNEQMHRLGKIVNSPEFVPESVREVSKACESLCRWVQAVYEFCLVQNQLLLKKQLEAQAEKIRTKLQPAEKQKKDAWNGLEDAKRQLQLVKWDLEDVLLELREAEDMEREAATTAGQLETHIRSWRAAAQVTQSTNIPS